MPRQHCSDRPNPGAWPHDWRARLLWGPDLPALAVGGAGICGHRRAPACARARWVLSRRLASPAVRPGPLRHHPGAGRRPAFALGRHRSPIHRGITLMKRFWLSLGRFAVTLVVVSVAAIVIWQFWLYYMVAPWTRDGRVRADVVGVAPDVSGLVTEVLVHDNQQVSKGDPLFRIDSARFELALRQAEAVVENRRATWDEAVREMNRYLALSHAAVSVEKQQQTTASATSAGA